MKHNVYPKRPEQAPPFSLTLSRQQVEVALRDAISTDYPAINTNPFHVNFPAYFPEPDQEPVVSVIADIDEERHFWRFGVKEAAQLLVESQGEQFPEDCTYADVEPIDNSDERDYDDSPRPLTDEGARVFWRAGSDE